MLADRRAVAAVLGLAAAAGWLGLGAAAAAGLATTAWAAAGVLLAPLAVLFGRAIARDGGGRREATHPPTQEPADQSLLMGG
jgi:hypothetical protein